MDDANGNGEAVWTKIELDPAPKGLDLDLLRRVNEYPLMASIDSREAEALQDGRCICGNPLAEETIILSNSTGNLAVMCSPHCFSDHMALGFLSGVIEDVGREIEHRGRMNDDPEV
jgi:hypothetical protein